MLNYIKYFTLIAIKKLLELLNTIGFIISFAIVIVIVENYKEPGFNIDPIFTYFIITWVLYFYALSIINKKYFSKNYLKSVCNIPYQKNLRKEKSSTTTLAGITIFKGKVNFI